MKTLPTILLIDDDPDFVEATCTVLESVPYDVVVAYNGAEGLARAREARPDVIILDVIMPVEDGFQTLKKLRDDPGLARIPVMMLTSLSSGRDLISSSEVDTVVEEYIDKPIKPAELLQQVEKLLRMREGRNTPRPTAQQGPETHNAHNNTQLR